MARQQLRDFEGARDAYFRALELQPGNSALRNSYGFMLVNTRQAEEAVAQFRKILTENPGDTAAQVNIGFAFLPGRAIYRMHAITTPFGGCHR